MTNRRRLKNEVREKLRLEAKLARLEAEPYWERNENVIAVVKGNIGRQKVTIGKLTEQAIGAGLSTLEVQRMILELETEIKAELEAEDG